MCVETLTENQVRAYILADNKLAENAGWSKEVLAIELQNLLTLDELDVTVTGFEIPEIDVILEGVTAISLRRCVPIWSWSSRVNLSDVTDTP